MTTDPTITIAGLRAQVESLIESIGRANSQCASFCDIIDESRSVVARVEAERDALAAQLAEVRAKLDAAPKVCAIHSYEHGPGPCMTCGAWPPGTRELIAACQTRIAGLELAANERSAEVARLTARVAELEARPVLTEERLRGALFACADGASDAEVRAILAALGPVTLPAQDVAARLTKAYSLEAAAVTGNRIDNTAAMERALASLGAPPTSPPAARPVFAGVSASDLDVAYIGGQRECHQRHQGAIRDCCRYAAVRAVLARLEVSLVAPVDPEEVAREYHAGGALPDVPSWTEISSFVRHIATQAMRTALRASGIPVTPEVDK